VSALNEFVYCPRRYYYQRYYDEIGEPYELVDGRSKHEHASRRGNWVTERYFRSDDLGMHGKIDLIDTEDGTPTRSNGSVPRADRTTRATRSNSLATVCCSKRPSVNP